MPQPQTRPGDKSRECPGRGNSPPTRATLVQLRPASVRLQFRLERGDILRLNLPNNERHAALARADSGQAALQRVEVDLAEVVFDVAERLVPLAQQSGMVLAIDTLPE